MRTACDDLAEMHDLSRRLAFPAQAGSKMKGFYDRLADATGVSWSSAKKYWSGDKKVIPNFVLENLRDAVAAHERETRARFLARETERARHYPLTHESIDQEFYRQRVDEVIGPSGSAD